MVINGINVSANYRVHYVTQTGGLG